jgi:hypothetical protein
MLIIDIVNFLNSLSITKRNNIWKSRAVSQIVNNTELIKI